MNEFWQVSGGVGTMCAATAPWCRKVTLTTENLPGTVAHPFSMETEADGAVLHRADLHGSLSDPTLDTMNFLNEITLRYPQVVSFAPDRPYDGFFDLIRLSTSYLTQADISEGVERLGDYIEHEAQRVIGPDRTENG